MNFKKIPYFKLIPIILISFILYKLVDNIESLTVWIKYFLSLINYFVWGFAIAYLLNPIINYLEKKLKIKRGLSIAIIYSAFLGIIVLVVTLIAPRIIKSIMDLVQKLPGFINDTELWVNTMIDKYKAYDKFGIDKYLQDNLNYIIKQANNILSSALNLVFFKLINFTSTLFTLVTGIVISVYFLKDKESIIRSLKRILYSVFGDVKANNIINFGKKVDDIFSQFVLGKLLDSLIMGVICFIALTILNIPYALLISLIIGITNMIPYFGNVIGLVPSCIITLFSSTVKTVELVIFILILSQFDGWFLSPRIVGQKVGLNPLLIILAIAVGGGLFGIMGMFLGVPIMAVIKTLVGDFIDKKLEDRIIDVVE